MKSAIINISLILLVGVVVYLIFSLINKNLDLDTWTEFSRNLCAVSMFLCTSLILRFRQTKKY